MDTPTQTPSQQQDEKSKKLPIAKSARPWIILCIIIILSLVAALIWCWFFYKNGHSSDTPSGATPEPGSATASGPCTGGAANTLPAGFTFYENASLGYKFAYPTAWGTVSVTTTPLASESGDYVMGKFSAKENAWFGGNATDYVVSGRDGVPTDLPGYLKSYNKYYTVELWRFTDGSTTENRHDLHPIELPYEEKAGCNTKALVTHWDASELSSVGPADIARFTLRPDNKYYGVNVVIDKPTDADKADLAKLVSSFQLLP